MTCEKSKKIWTLPIDFNQNSKLSASGPHLPGTDAH
jgi:hypothetical protein